MYRIMRALINGHYYSTKTAVTDRLTAFHEHNQLTDAQYTELVALTETKYGD